MKPTRFSVVYNSFLSKITDDMYLQLTQQDTMKILRQLLISAIPKFQFPRQSLQYAMLTETTTNPETGKKKILDQYQAFINPLTKEQIDVLSTYMVVEWIGQQLASIDNTRMKDYYDLYMFVNYKWEEIDKDILDQKAEMLSFLWYNINR